MIPKKSNTAKFSEKSLRAGLTMRQFKFCEGYLRHYDSAKAYVEAGYTAKNRHVAHAGACRLLKTDEAVQAYINTAEKEILKSMQLNRGALIKRAMEIAMGVAEEETIIIEGMGDGNSKARKIKKKPALKDQLKSIEFLDNYMKRVEESEGPEEVTNPTDDKLLKSLAARTVNIEIPDDVKFEEEEDDENE
jgi:phage terminase small subunit